MSHDITKPTQKKSFTQQAMVVNRHNNLLYPTEYPNPNCRLCNSKAETSSHIICECEEVCIIRYFHFQTIVLPLAPIPIIKQLTSFLNDS